MYVSGTSYEHVGLNKEEVLVMLGLTMKVVEYILPHFAYGWIPGELHFQFPHLTMLQIHSALAYYWDHQEELDKDIENRLLAVDQYRQSSGESPLVARLKAKWLI